MWVRALVWAGCVCLAASPAVALQSSPSTTNQNGGAAFATRAHETLPPDPTIHTGVLPNGLRYAVTHVERPKGGVSIRLGVDVGSYEEAEGERGLAHFIEHLAFRSTRHFPDNAVDGAFAHSGVAFGRDHNAGTELFSTQFELDLPRTDGGELTRAFAWLRDVADGVLFDPVAIDIERGVVLAEKEARNSAGQATQEALIKFQTSGVRAFDRSPIGTEAVLHSAGAGELEAFYRRWYRPENAVVVMAGDLPAETMEAEIRDAFGTWRAAGEKPARTAIIQPNTQRPLEVFSRSENAGIAGVEVCRLGPSQHNRLQDLARVREDALSDIWVAALNQRLLQLRQRVDNHVLGEQAAVADNRRDFRLACLDIKPTGAGWDAALRASEAEMLRFQKAGPTGLEIEQATDSVRGHLRGAIDDAPNRTGSAIADGILQDMLEGMPTVDPRQRLRAFDRAVEDITIDDVRAAFANDWAGAGPLISVVAPDAPGAPEIREAWLETEQGAGLATYTDRKTEAWGYPVDKPGEVVSREPVAQGAFVRLHFRNGVVLNFKQTAFKTKSAAFIISFGIGRKQLDSHDYLLAVLGGSILPVAGLGKHNYEEITRIAGVDIRDLHMNVGDYSFLIGGEDSTANLDDMLRVAAAYMLDPAFRPTLDPVVHEAVDLTYRLTASTPALTASNALANAISPDNPLALPPKPEMASLDAARIGAVLKPILTTEPIDVTLVGDIDEKTAIRLIATTFGALPSRTPVNRERSDVFYLRYPPAGLPPIRVEHHGPADQALGELIWPLYVATPERRREEYAIRLLAAVFSDALRHDVRGQLGKTYAPTVFSHMPDHADQGFLIAGLESYPADLDALVAAARTVSKRLAAGEITADQLDAVRAPILAKDMQDMQSNTRWAAALSDSIRDGANLHDILAYSTEIAAVRLDEVKKAAADWLSREPIVITAMPAPGAGDRP